MSAARRRSGAISLSMPSHLPTMPASKLTRPVRLPPGRARLATKPGPNRIGDIHKYYRDRVALPSHGRDHQRRLRNDQIGFLVDQFLREQLKSLRLAFAEAVFHPDSPAIRPAKTFKTPSEAVKARLHASVVCFGQQHPHARRVTGLLRARAAGSDAGDRNQTHPFSLRFKTASGTGVHRQFVSKATRLSSRVAF
jgi:hypothetical protein